MAMILVVPEQVRRTRPTPPRRALAERWSPVGSQVMAGVWLVGAGGTRTSLVWPYGWRYDADAEVVNDSAGQAWARNGQKVSAGRSALGTGDYAAGDDCVVAPDGYALTPT